MTVKIEGLDAVLKKIDSLGKPGVLYTPMSQSLNHLQDLVAKYPRKKQGAFSALATPGQKRAFWARVGSGEISFREGIGYVRSGTLGRKWIKRIEKGGRGGTLMNNAGYGPYVQSDAGQQPFHAVTKYNKTDEVAKKEASKVIALFKAAYDAAVK